MKHWLTAIACAVGVHLATLKGSPYALRAAQDLRGSIHGVVTKRPGGDAAAGAVIKILNEPFGDGPPGAQTQSATAGADGSFVLNDVEPGTYWMVANLPGFLPFEYGQRSPTGVGTSFDVRAGQRVNARLALWSTSGISGRVVDADGDPVGRAQVLALRSMYDGGKASITIAQTVTTNDRGEYRMFWLTPGSYRVAARLFDTSNASPMVNIGPPRRFGATQQGTSPVFNSRTIESGAVIEEVAVPIFAPSTSELALAQTVVLAPGENSAGVDVQLIGHHVPSHHVRGFFRGAIARTTPMLSQVLLVSRVASPMAVVPGALVRTDGSFDIPGVVSGSYILYARDGSAAVPVEVGDSDVDNVVLTESAGVEIAGRLIVERGSATGSFEMSNLRFQVARDPEVIGTPPGGPRFNPPPAADGSFSWTISPGDYRVAVIPLWNSQRDDRMRAGGGPPISDVLQNAYVKSIRWGRSDVLVDGLHTWGGGSQGTMEIVVSLSGAEAEGVVRDGAGRAVEGAIVVAVPDGSNRGRSDLYRHGTTDRGGLFMLRGLAPGDYSFYAWDDLERGAWESVEFLRAFEGRGRFARLREGKNDVLDLNLVVGR